VRPIFSSDAQNSPGAHQGSCIMSNVSRSRGYSGRAVGLTPHTSLAPRLQKEYSYTSTPSVDLHGLSYGEFYILHLIQPINMRFSPVPATSSLLGPNIFLNILKLWCSLNVRGS